MLIYFKLHSKSFDYLYLCHQNNTVVVHVCGGEAVGQDKTKSILSNNTPFVISRFVFAFLQGTSLKPRFSRYTSSNHRLESAGLNTLEKLLF